MYPPNVTTKRIGIDNRFIDHGDGTVTDTRTGLMWMRPAIGQIWENGTCHGKAEKLNIVSAKALHIRFANTDDWRLPTIFELLELLKHGEGPLKIDVAAFPNPAPGYYWSSTLGTEAETQYRNWPKIITNIGTRGHGNPVSGMENLRLVRRNITETSINIELIGNGNGDVIKSRYADEEIFGRTVTLTAHPKEGSIFKGWSGAATGHATTCTLTMDSTKMVLAEFVQLESFALQVNVTGTGTGNVSRSPKAETYFAGSTVTLTAHRTKDCKFLGWRGAASGADLTCTITMDSAKTVLAEFVQLESFALQVNVTGTGTGNVSRSPKVETYFAGSTVTLTAHPTKGHEFLGWRGAASGPDLTCTITMDSAKTVSAEFVPLDSFELETTTIGTGSGRIKRSDNALAHFAGSTVTLTAQADEGSIFSGWQGDYSGLDDVCTVTMISDISVSADFEKLTIADTEISVEITSVKRDYVKNQEANIFRLTIRNNGREQTRIKIPLTNYVRQTGLASEQSSWLAGLVNGTKGVTLTAGSFGSVDKSC